jgi:hypothetical protein
MVQITVTIAAFIIIAAVYFKFFLFKPKANIHYIVFRFNKPKRSIAITGDPGANASSLEFVLFPIDRVKQFPFRFKKLVTDKESAAKGFETSFNIPDDLSQVVEREEPVWGYRARELHPVVVEFLSKDKVDMFIVLQIACKSIDAVTMFEKSKNWLEYAETEIVDIIGTWGRNTNSDDIFATDIDKLQCKAGKNEKITVIDQLNAEKFNGDSEETNYGFKAVSMAIYKIGNGKRSQDVIDQAEEIAKKKRELEAAKLQKQIDIEKGMAHIVILEKTLEKETKAFEDRSKTVIKVMETRNETAIAVADELGSLQNGSIFFGGKSPLETETADMQNVMMGNIAATTFTKRSFKKDDRKGGGDEK